MPLQAIVFDFDGVIANSEPLHYLAFRDVLADLEIPLSESDYYRHYLGFDDAGVFRAVLQGAPPLLSTAAAALPAPTRIHDLVARKARRFEALERAGAALFPGAVEAITRASALAPLAIASGARRDEILRVLDREALGGRFTAIVAAEDTQRSKPAPDPYLRAVALLAEASGSAVAAGNCLALEDSIWGLESAGAAGLRTVGVAHTYSVSTLAGADLVVESIAALDWHEAAQLCS